MLKCYIVDDEFGGISLLQKYIEKTPGLALYAYSENPVEALEQLNSENEADVLFLDVNMPQISGLTVSSLLNRPIDIIFTTAFPNYALDAFDLKARDFLLKPFSYERFLQAVERVRERRIGDKSKGSASESDSFYIKTDIKGKMVRVKFEDVLYIKGAQNYLEIYLKDQKKHLTYLTLWEMENALPTGLFTRVHKSFIINLTHIRSVEGGAVILDDGTLILIGINFRDKFQGHLNRMSIVSKRNLNP